MSTLGRMLAAVRFEWHIARAHRLLARAKKRHDANRLAGPLIDRAGAHNTKAERLRLCLKHEEVA